MNFFKKNNNESWKWKIVIWSIWWLWFLIVSVLVVNIFQNPILEEKNYLTESEKFEELHWSSENLFTWKQKIQKNFYLINFVEQISKIYEEKWKISYVSDQEKELFLRSVAKKYTLENIEQFRNSSTAEENVEKFSWRLLNKTVPVWFEIDMEDLEWIFVSSVK